MDKQKGFYDPNPHLFPIKTQREMQGLPTSAKQRQDGFKTCYKGQESFQAQRDKSKSRTKRSKLEAPNCPNIAPEPKHYNLANLPKHNISSIKHYLNQMQVGGITPANDSSALFWHPPRLRIPINEHTGKSTNNSEKLAFLKNALPGMSTTRQASIPYWRALGNHPSQQAILQLFPNDKPSKFQCYTKRQLTETASTLSTIPPNQKDKSPIVSKPRQQKHALCLSDFIIIKTIGEGKFSSVQMVRHRKTGFLCALKSIKKERIEKENLLSQILRELKISLFTYHPHLISMYGYFDDEENLYLLEELACDGQLYARLKEKGKFGEEATSFIVRQILEVVRYLHKNKILHRDIKPENIVITHGNVKLCDLGWSVYVQHNKLRETICGTPLYSPPELLQGMRYNEKIDLWAIGILAYELRFGHIPFNIKVQQQLIKIITDEVIFPAQTKTSSEFRNFIQSILKKNPSERLNCEQLLQHPFIKKYRDFQTCEQLCFF